MIFPSAKQQIKDAIMDNDFLKNIDASQVREQLHSSKNSGRRMAFIRLSIWPFVRFIHSHTHEPGNQIKFRAKMLFVHQIEGEHRTWAIKVAFFGYISAGQERHHHHLHKPSYFVHPSVDPSVSQSVSQSIIRIVFVCVSFSIPINLFGIFGCQFFPLFTPPHFFWPANTFCLLLSICAANQKQKVFDVACCIFK